MTSLEIMLACVFNILLVKRFIEKKISTFAPAESLSHRHHIFLDFFFFGYFYLRSKYLFSYIKRLKIRKQNLTLKIQNLNSMLLRKAST